MKSINYLLLLCILLSTVWIGCSNNKTVDESTLGKTTSRSIAVAETNNGLQIPTSPTTEFETVTSNNFSRLNDILNGVSVSTTEYAKTAPIILVAASNATARVKKHADYICDGIDDQVEIQAAVDAMVNATGYEGTVQLSEGLFTVGKLSTQTTVTLTATIAKSGDSGHVAGEVHLDTLSFSAGAIGDVAVGQMYRLSGGSCDVSAQTIEQHYQEHVATVTEVGADYIHLKGGGFLWPDTSGRRYTTVTVERLTACIDLKPGVGLVGSGQYGTVIKLGNAQNCTVITSCPTSQRVGVRLNNLVINGNRTQQTSTTKSIGYAFNWFCWDSHVNDVSVITCKSDGRWYQLGWGHHLRGGWTEFNEGMGVCVGNVESFEMCGHKIASNGKEALYLRTTQHALIHGNLLSAGVGGTGYAIRMSASNNSVINGNEIRSLHTDCDASPTHGDPKGGIFLNSPSCIITNNVFYSDASLRGIRIGSSVLSAGAYNNLIANNAFTDGIAMYPISLGYIWGCDNIYGNTNCMTYFQATDGSADVGPYPQTIVSRRVLNNSGGTLNYGYLAKWNDAYKSSIATPTSKTATDFAGLLAFTTSPVTTAFTNYLQTEGYCNKFPYDNDAAASSGSELCISEAAGEEGVSTLAGSGDYVVAIALPASPTDGLGTILVRSTGIPAYILPKAERYLKP